VFNRVCAKLRQWTPDGRRESLEAAIASGWGDVFPPRQGALGLPNGSSRRTSTTITHDSRLQVGEFLRANGLA
jgi:lysophospholipase L1-like esterase